MGNWVRHDAVAIATKEVLDTVDPDEVSPMRKMTTDKDESTRGNKKYVDHPLLAKTRDLLPGYKDKQYLAGELKTHALTLTDAATAIILQQTASNEGWDLQQGDADSAFLDGRYLDPGRRVFSSPEGRFARPTRTLLAMHPWM